MDIVDQMIENAKTALSNEKFEECNQILHALNETLLHTEKSNEEITYMIYMSDQLMNFCNTLKIHPEASLGIHETDPLTYLENLIVNHSTPLLERFNKTTRIFIVLKIEVAKQRLMIHQFNMDFDGDNTATSK